MSDSLGREIDLLAKYPKPKRDISKRANFKTPQQQQLARKFGKDFFDGDRSNGYGGYYYNERFWVNVIPDFIKFYNLIHTLSGRKFYHIILQKNIANFN